MANTLKGRGWHGDPEGHRRAGRLGGKARAKNQRRMSKIVTNAI